MQEVLSRSAVEPDRLGWSPRSRVSVLKEETLRQACTEEVLRAFTAPRPVAVRRLIRSLWSVAEEVGHIPTVTEYRGAERGRRGTDEALEEMGRVIRHFGSGRVAKEALELSESSSERKTEAPLRARRLGKVWAGRRALHLPSSGPYPRRWKS